jgi:hypothetical protein
MIRSAMTRGTVKETPDSMSHLPENSEPASLNLLAIALQGCKFPPNDHVFEREVQNKIEANWIEFPERIVRRCADVQFLTAMLRMIEFLRAIVRLIEFLRPRSSFLPGLWSTTSHVVPYL